ncbi:MAG: alpha/beta hydrolase [Thermoleophilaceae bacterium]
MRRLAPILPVLVALACSPAAHASYLPVKGAPAAGPSTFDRVHIETFGSSKAKNVLVLIPGTGGGSHSLAPIARDYVRGVKGLQVWSVDRREQAFQDLDVLKRGNPSKSAAHYLGFKYRRTTAENAAFAADWGLATSLNDIRRVVLKARAGGRRRVFLGGHSRGASTAAAYAAWDFKGRAGYRDLDGLFLIDGGLLGSIAGGSVRQLSPANVNGQVREIRGGKVFNDPLGAGIPEIGTIFLNVAAQYAAKLPSRSSPLRSLAILPAALKPPFAVTNEAFLGRIFDKATSPRGFEALRLNAGRVAAKGHPRPWVDGERTPLQTFAKTFAQARPNATEWYFPQRLILDIAVANPMRRDAVASSLGLRLWHTKQIDTPLFVAQTDLTHGSVKKGAQRLINTSKIRTYAIQTDTGMSHLDAVLAPRRTNVFTRSGTKFLNKILARPTR